MYEIFHNEKLGTKDLMTKPHMYHYKDSKKVVKQSILDDYNNYYSIFTIC